MRLIETATRGEWQVLVDALLDGDLQKLLTHELESWDGGDTCCRVGYSTDSVGRIDSMSRPSPDDAD